jgi:hypothetical protein
MYALMVHKFQAGAAPTTSRVWDIDEAALGSALQAQGVARYRQDDNGTTFLGKNVVVTVSVNDDGLWVPAQLTDATAESLIQKPAIA